MKRKVGPCNKCTDVMDCGSWNNCFYENRPMFPEGFVENLTYSNKRAERVGHYPQDPILCGFRGDSKQ